MDTPDHFSQVVFSHPLNELQLASTKKFSLDGNIAKRETESKVWISATESCLQLYFLLYESSERLISKAAFTPFSLLFKVILCIILHDFK
jgi:hypothetical protein